MPTLESKSASLANDARETAVEFRVSRPGAPRRRLRLVGPRYTLGSGQDCSVRLEDPSLRPLHAVLTCDANQVFLRACGAAIPINGRAVTEAVLRPGDRLQLGVYEFELMAPSALPESRPVESRPVEFRPADSRASEMKAAEARAIEFKAAELRAAEIKAFDLQSIPRANNTRSVRVVPSANTTPVPVDSTLSTAALGSDSKIVPRRRLSFLETAAAISSVDPPNASAPSHPVITAPATIPADPIAKVAVASTATVPQVENSPALLIHDAEELALIAKLRQSPSTSPDERAAALLDQHRALLANERRWQERNRRQLERFRQREQRSREQVEQILAVQESAERRARQAEDSVHALSLQLAELTGQIASLQGTALPGIEDRFIQQQSDTTLTLNGYRNVIESLHERLDQLQLAISDVQSESRSLRQEAAANRADHLEVTANADHLESLIRRLNDTCDANRAECDLKLDELRESLYATSRKVADTTNQIEETRQTNHALGALVQQLRSTLATVQSDSQRFATLEQISDAQRQIQSSDERMARLVNELALHQTQMQQEFESLRSRIDEAEEAVDRAARSAADALTRAVESQTHQLRSPLLTPASSAPVAPASSAPVTPASSAPVAAVVPPNVADGDERLVEHHGRPLNVPTSNELVSEPLKSPLNELTQEIANEAAINPLDGPRLESTYGQPEVNQGVDLDVEKGVDPSERELSQSSPFYSPVNAGENRSAISPIKPLEIAPSIHNEELPSSAKWYDEPADRSGAEVEEVDSAAEDFSRYQSSHHDVPSSFDHPVNGAESIRDDQQSDSLRGFLHNPLLQKTSRTSGAEDDANSDSTIDYELPHYHASDNPERADSSYSEDHSGEKSFDTDDLSVYARLGDSLGTEDGIERSVEDEYIDGSTYQFDPQASGLNLGIGLSSDPPASPQRSAAEILASLGFSLGESETDGQDLEESDGGKTEYLPQGMLSALHASESIERSTRSELENSSSEDELLTNVMAEQVRPAESPRPSLNAAPATDEVEDEDSIEAYMNRLLKRVQGTSENAPAAPKSQAVEAKREPAKAITVAEPTVAVTSTVAVPAPVPAIDSPYIPRSQAPERTSNMAAMRELANSSARTAIAESARQRMMNQVMFKFMLFVMGILAGFFTLAGTGFAIDKWLLVAMCCFGLATFYLMEGIGIRKQLIEAALPEEPVSEEPLQRELPTQA